MGNISGATTEHVKPDIFDQTLSINARGTMLILRAVSAAMAKQEPREHKNLRTEGTRSLGRGSIVVVGSINSIMAAPGMLSYCASKWAVLGMAKTAGEPHLILKSESHLDHWTIGEVLMNPPYTNSDG